MTNLFQFAVEIVQNDCKCIAGSVEKGKRESINAIVESQNTFFKICCIREIS